MYDQGLLGAWNAHHANTPPRLSFEPRTNSFALRWDRTPAWQQLSRLRDLRDHRYFHDAYKDVSLDAGEEFLKLIEKLNRTVASLPPYLCFGDCNVGNLFSGESETVAVDWASIANDPIGVDAGCMIGSAICWGRDGAAIASEERSLFETYLRAVTGSGNATDPASVRRAYLT